MNEGDNNSMGDNSTHYVTPDGIPNQDLVGVS